MACRLNADNRPGTPTMHDVSTDSITIRWNKPEISKPDICCYDIRFRELGETKWRLKATENAEEIETISNLKGDTAYEFKVRADLGDEESPDSNTSSEIRTKLSLARQVIKYSTKVDKKLEPGQPVLYKIPIKESATSRNTKAKTRKYVFENTNRGVQEKTIMLIGATGVGKSTLIDGMINYILDVSWEDNFRFTVIDPMPEEKQKSIDQSMSQTEWITTYQINHTTGSQIHYTLNIIDIPGFGDTRGIQRDRVIVNQFRELLNTTGDQGEKTLDGVCFVTQAPLARLSPAQKYIFDSILSIFGNDIVGNIFALITFADGKTPPVLNALKAEKVPIVESFLFNNSALFAPNVNVPEASFSIMFWKLGKKSFKTFFKRLQNVQPRSLQLTSEVLSERQQIENLIQGLRPKIDEGLSKLETLRQERRLLEEHRADIAGNRNFEYSIDKPCSRRVNLQAGVYTTICVKCNRTCHHRCVCANGNDKIYCCVMSNGFCTVCPNKCKWDVHRKNTFEYEFYTETVKGTYTELKQRYQSALEGEKRQNSIIQATKADFREVSSQVGQMIDRMRTSLNRLTEIALKPNPLSDVDYIDLLIESEKSEGKPGFQSRVVMLKNLREDAELMQQLLNGKVTPFGYKDLDQFATSAPPTPAQRNTTSLVSQIKNWFA